VAILFCLQDWNRPGPRRQVHCGLQSRLFHGIDLCRSGLWRYRIYWRLDLVELVIPNTLDALQVLSGSQVTPGVCVSMRIRPICKHIYTWYPNKSADRCEELFLCFTQNRRNSHTTRRINWVVIVEDHACTPRHQTLPAENGTRCRTGRQSFTCGFG
jgi:hypothetical protein